ncbi:MAG: hypothetical protein H6737_19160 [Alphaproteobacteria bacterium]|nr:hypothetical protein [Alphaproteobacteria bacterium]
MHAALALLLFAGCPGKDKDDTDTDTDTDATAFAPLLLDAAPETGVLLGAWSDGATAILVGGDYAGIGRITRYDGTSFCVEADEVPGVLWWVHGRGPGDWYAVGEDGIIVHEQNGTRTREDVPTTSTLFGVYDDGTDVWAVGGDVRNTQDGEIWRKPAGGAWELFQGEIDGLMLKTWNHWFVGDGIAYWWDGTQLVERPPPNDVKLFTITGAGDRVWAVGGEIVPTLLEWDGSAWVNHTVSPSCAGGQGLNGVWTDGTDVYVAGHNGAASVYDGTDWTCDVPPLTTAHFHAAWKHGDEHLWVGGNLFSPTDNTGTVVVHPARADGPMSVSVCE